MAKLKNSFRRILLSEAVFYNQTLRKCRLLFVPFFLPPLLRAAADGFTMAAYITLHDAEYTPHARLYIPPQGAGAVQVIARIFCPFRLDAEHITYADRALNGNCPCKGIIGLCAPAMSVQRKTDVSRLIRRHQQAKDNALADIRLKERRRRVAVRFGVEYL